MSIERAYMFSTDDLDLCVGKDSRWVLAQAKQLIDEIMALRRQNGSPKGKLVLMVSFEA